MTPKQILDSFSETLIQDERILNGRERALVLNFLQHARSASKDNPETGAAVSAVIASAIGETVAQRAFSVLGASIVERIIESTQVANSDATGFKASNIFAKKPSDQPDPPHVKAPPMPLQPEPPHSPGPARDNPPIAPQPPQPEPPHVKAPPKPPKPPQPEPPHDPRPPHAPRPMRDMPPPASQPEPPHATLPERRQPVGGVAVLERPATSAEQCVVLDEFLAPQELEELTCYTLEHAGEFFASEVVSPNHDDGVHNYEHRRSIVLEELGKFQEVMLDRIKSVLPQVLPKLGIEEFSVTQVEAQITASNDGDFFHAHCDDGDARVAQRRLTFVYFFHREPRRFEGGELRIYGPGVEGDHDTGTYQSIVPQQNQIVFFPCSALHEITPVECPSKLFADSRFTLNGWLHK
jgi:hypothetical protein